MWNFHLMLVPHLCVENASDLHEMKVFDVQKKAANKRIINPRGMMLRKREELSERNRLVASSSNNNKSRIETKQPNTTTA